MYVQKSLAAAGGIAGITLGSALVHRRLSGMTETYPFIGEGAQAAKLNPGNTSYWKAVHVDDTNNVGYATFSIDGKVVRVTAKRQVSPTVQSESKTIDDSIYDDLEAEGSGLALYWENPWEIKASAIRGAEAVGRTLRKYKTQMMRYVAAVDFEDEESAAADTGRWELLSVAVDNQAIVGDLMDHPHFASEAMETVNGLKSDYSKQRAKYVLSGLLGAAAFLGVRRVYTNYRMWPSYNFSKNFIINHPNVKVFYAPDGADIVTRTGRFDPARVEAEITITGKPSGSGLSGTESVVKFEASKKKSGDWMVSKATMTPTGCKSIDLLVAAR